MDLVIAALVLLLSLILLLPLFKNYKEQKRIAQYIDKLPGEKWYPIIGTTLKALKTSRGDLFELLLARHKKFGPFVRSWYGQMPFVHIYKPEHAQVIFRSSIESNKGQGYRFLFPWLGQGLISGSGSHWKAHRKIITPSFHFKVLDNYVETFAEKSDDFVEYLKQFDGKGYFEMTEHLNRIGLDIITETAMGVKLNFLEGQEGKHLQYAHAIVDFCTVVYKRLYNPLLAIDFIFKRLKIGKESQKNADTIHKFTSNVIQRRKEYFKTHKSELMQVNELGIKKKLSFLDMLLAYQEEHDFTDDEIQEEVNTFMFGGQDTTVSALTYAFLALGNYPEIAKHVQDELDTIFVDDPNRKITPQDLAKMEYMDRVLKEVLRCYCFVPILARTLTEDVEIDGVVLPKGCNLTIDLYDLHHDPDHYPDPYKFDPDRFLPEAVAKRHPYAYVPFSAGPRNCLGQKFAMRNIKTLLASILRKYNLKCQEKHEDLKCFLEIVLRPQTGIHVSLESRK